MDRKTWRSTMDKRPLCEQQLRHDQKTGPQFNVERARKKLRESTQTGSLSSGECSAMQTRQHIYRPSALVLLLFVGLLALAALQPVTSSARCFAKPREPTPAVEPQEVFDEPEVSDDVPVPDETVEDGQPSEGSKADVQSPTSDISTGSDASTPSLSAEDHATFGDIVSGDDKCVIGNPSTYVTREDVDWVWKHTMEKYVPQFTNLAFDQLVTNNGSLSYCVRWDNDKKLTKAVASKFQAMLEKQLNLWHRWLVGYNCWPIDKIDVTIVGYAVRDKAIMDWSDDSLGTIYEGVLDAEGSPMCPDECYKHKGQAASADTSACKAEPFDMSFWPSTKPGENAIGTGGDWGQRVEVNDMLANMENDHMIVLLHEIGHSFGLPEMYEGKNKPSTFPVCVMDAHDEVTDGDGWLLRSILENIKSRYDF